LTREEMLAGKVPTTATTASVIAALQTQEAVKLLHQDRIGQPTLAGAGFQFVGLTHDSYVIRYRRRDDCYSHDTYELESAEVVEHDVTFGELLDLARARLGDRASLELEHELVLAAECGQCGHRAEVLKPVDALSAGSGICPECSNEWRLLFTHAVDAESPLLGLHAADVGLPPGDVVVGRVGLERCFFLLTGPGSAIDLVREPACT